MASAIITWPTGLVSLSWQQANHESLPVTGAHGFCFAGSEVVLCGIAGRGLTIPGGHLEERETAEQCLLREAAEEASIELAEPVLLGYMVVDHSINRAYSGPYPVKAAQVIFFANVFAMRNFERRAESSHRVLAPFEKLSSYHHEWNASLQAAYEEALRIREIARRPHARGTI